ncbi:hypothetical protein SLE2022_047220 [Rubroshorea leprosula]
MGGEEDYETKEEGSGDGMKLVQQLFACAEAVACQDKTYASVLLSELRANALVFGTSFQRVVSCFVQGLADCLSLVQPLGTVGVVGPKAKWWFRLLPRRMRPYVWSMKFAHKSNSVIL